MLFLTVSVLAVLATLGVAQPQTHKSFNPPASGGFVDWDTLGSAPVENLNNAQRLARNLPPLSPKSLRRPRHRGSHTDRATRVRTAPRAATSPLPPVTTKCNIFVKDLNGTDYGFINSTLNIAGEYGFLQSTSIGALEVSFSYQPGASSQLDMIANNGPAPGFPRVGAIVGYASDDSNFGPGNFSYAPLAGTQQTPPGSVPVNGDSTYGVVNGIPADLESAIWSYDPVTQDITAQWINTDGSAPATLIVYAIEQDTLLITGDADTLRSTFGVSWPDVSFACVPCAAVPDIVAPL